MNVFIGTTVTTSYMSSKPTPLTPKEKEIQTLYARGKTPEMIAIRMGMKLSKVMMAISMMSKTLG